MLTNAAAIAAMCGIKAPTKTCDDCGTVGLSQHVLRVEVLVWLERKTMNLCSECRRDRSVITILLPDGADGEKL